LLTRLLATLRSVERVLVRVEEWMLTASLLAMLGLAVYGIAYRNVVIPFVGWLEAGEREEAVIGGAGSGEDESYGSDFGDDDEKEPAKTPEANPEPGGGSADFGSDFGSDFGDDDGEASAGATAAPPAAPASPPAPPAERGWLIGLLLWFNFDWLDVVLRHLILWVGFFGGALATTRNSHITIDALSRSLPPGAKRRVGVVTSLVATGISAALAHAGWKFTLLEAESSVPLFGDVPAWVGPAIVPVGFGLIAFHFAVRCLEHIEAGPTGEMCEPGETA
jgi:TRAP-type C4-dicarboxylate transport system permease small subunit